MRFETNTKPVVSGLDLGIITSNITKFYQKSCIVELTIEETGLRINTEVSAVKSEMVFKGSVSGDGENHVFVDSLLFKNLMKSLTSDTVEFEINADGLTVYSGKSKFNLAQVVSGADLELSRPQQNHDNLQSFDIDKAGWEFIKDQQMYAIAMSFIHPVYTHAWLSETGDVIVGDFDNSIFTHSHATHLTSTCLLTDTIINLLSTVPEDSQIMQLGRNYEIKVATDPYTYLCEFTPRYEDDEGIGDYSAGLILQLFNHGDGAVIDSEVVSKYIAQAELFSTTNDDTINLEMNQNSFNLVNQNVNCKIPVTSPFQEFSITFKISLLKDAISHMDSAKVSVCPLVQDGQVSGIILWTDNVETVLAGID